MNIVKYRLPLVTALLGIAACILRFSLYTFGTDEKGLLVTGHPLTAAVWLLSAAAALFVVSQVRKQPKDLPRESDFPGSMAAAIGCLLFAAGLLITVLNNRYDPEVLDFIRNILCLLAAPALAAVAVCRKQGSQPPFGCHALICLALTLHTVSYYRSWSSHPQLVDSFFPMMGCLLLMLFAYYQTAFDVHMGNRRMQLGTGLLAAFFCFSAMAGSDTMLLYLTGGIWTLTNLCVPEPHTNSKEGVQ